MATLKERLVDLAKAIGQQFVARDQRIDDLSKLVNDNQPTNNGLITTAKEHLVLAINEVFRMARENATAIAQLADRIGEGGMGASVKTYAAYPPVNLTVNETSTLILPGDEFRASVGFQCMTHDLAICFQPGKDASFEGDSQSKIILAGGFENLEGWGTGPVAAIARPSDDADGSVQFPAVLNLTIIGRTSETAPLPTKLTGDIRLSYLPDPGTDPRLLNALRTFINDMDDSDVPSASTLNAMSSLILAGHTPANGLVNLIQPELGPYELKQGTGATPIIHKPYSHWQGDGETQYINTRLLSGPLKFTPESHGMIAKVHGTDITSTAFIGGSSPNYYLNPNRSNIAAGFRDGSGGTEIMPAVPGDWVGINRRDAAGFYGWVGETSKFFERPFGSSAPGTAFNWLATNGGSTGFTAPTRQGLEIGCTFRGLISDATYLKILRGLQKVNAVQQTIAAERA